MHKHYEIILKFIIQKEVIRFTRIILRFTYLLLLSTALFEKCSLDWDCFRQRTFIIKIGRTRIEL
jgi:hypothetical protein